MVRIQVKRNVGFLLSLRKYKNDSEKIVWILIVVLANFVGALVYYLVIKVSNPKGVILKHKK